MDIINKMIKREIEKFENRAQNEAKKKREEEAQEREREEERKREEEAQEREREERRLKLEEDEQIFRKDKYREDLEKKVFLEKLEENTLDMEISCGKLNRRCNMHYIDFYEEESIKRFYDKNGVLLTSTVDETYKACPKNTKYKALVLNKFIEESYDQCYIRFLKEINDYRKFIRHHKLVKKESAYNGSGYIFG